MSSNVVWTVCPQCAELNSAIVTFPDEDSFHIVCQYCFHEFESGKLPWESIRLFDERPLIASDMDDPDAIQKWMYGEDKTLLVDMDVWDDRDGETGETGQVGDPGSDEDEESYDEERDRETRQWISGNEL